MPKGHYNIKLLHANGFTDKDFEIAKHNGTLDELLDSLEVRQEFDQDNQLSHYVAGNLFYWVFGAPSTSSPYARVGDMFHYVGFGNDSTEYDYSYSEANDSMINLFITPNGVTYGVNTPYDVKNTKSGIRTHQVIVEPDSSGLRAVYDVHRFLWTPSQANSSEIREVKYGSSNSPEANEYYSYDETRIFSRIRIKDANGNPQTITKTSDDVLLVQWTLTLKSI